MLLHFFLHIFIKNNIKFRESSYVLFNFAYQFVPLLQFRSKSSVVYIFLIFFCTKTNKKFPVKSFTDYLILRFELAEKLQPTECQKFERTTEEYNIVVVRGREHKFTQQNCLFKA